MTTAIPLFEGEAEGIKVTLYANGAVRLQGPRGVDARGRLDTVVLREWGEAHIVDCEARFGRSRDEDEEIYESLDDLLCAALAEDPSRKEQLRIPRAKAQLRELADSVGERLRPEEREQLLAQGPLALAAQLAVRENLPEEQAVIVLTEVLRELRDL